MKIIDTVVLPSGAEVPRTVEYTDKELLVVEKFHELLDQGHPLPFAAQLALNYKRRERGPYSIAFVAHLSEDTVKWWGHRFIVKPEWRDR